MVGVVFSTLLVFDWSPLGIDKSPRLHESLRGSAASAPVHPASAEVWTQAQVKQLLNLVYLLVIIILGTPYLILLFMTNLLKRMNAVRQGIEHLQVEPTHRVHPVRGELNNIVTTINDLAGNAVFFESFTRYLLDTIYDGVLTVDTAGIVQTANSQFLTIFSTSKPEVINRDAGELFSGGVAEIISDALHHQRFHVDRTVRWKETALRVYSRRIVNNDDRILGLLFVFRDITLMMQYEETLRHQDRLAALGEMAIGVVHELKNPFTSIRGFLQLIQRSVHEDDPQYRYLGLVHDELNRIDSILNEMLDYGGSSKLSLTLHDLRTVIDQLVSQMRELYPNLTVRVNTIGSDFTLQFDSPKMRQVFLNLLTNCIEAGTSAIDIKLSETEREVVAEFKDYGEGIPEDSIEKVFTPFFSTKPEGSGFGMPVCQKIIGSHGGTIRISSVVRQGTQVEVRLPRTSGALEHS